MATVKWDSTTMSGEESTGGGNNNNLYQTPFERVGSYDEKSNGMGLKMVSDLKPFEQVPGSHGNMRQQYLNREIGRYNELAAKAFGNPPINNAGIVLDDFGGAFGEKVQKFSDASGKPKVQK